jgi:hypothetical protein
VALRLAQLFFFYSVGQTSPARSHGSEKEKGEDGEGKGGEVLSDEYTSLLTSSSRETCFISLVSQEPGGRRGRRDVNFKSWHCHIILGIPTLRDSDEGSALVMNEIDTPLPPSR